MSFALFVGPSGIGKTYAVREWLLPMLLTQPRTISDLNPDRFNAALIYDPRTNESPDGQFPGERFADVAAWRRAERRPRVACLDAPSPESMAEAAVELGRLVLVMDEINYAWPNDRKPGPAAVQLASAGRHAGCMVVGGCRRVMELHNSVRANITVAYFGNPSDGNDRDDVRRVTSVDPAELPELAERGTFIEWHRQSGRRSLIRVTERRKITIRQL